MASNRSKSSKMRAEFNNYGKIEICPNTFNLGMTARQEGLLHQMMLNKEEESNPEKVKQAENVLSWINKHYDVEDVEEKDAEALHQMERTGPFCPPERTAGS